MSDYRVMVVPCPYEDLPCSSFVCDQPHRTKYYVGNPYSGALHAYPIYCKNCVDHMIATLAPDLSPDAAAVVQRVRVELEAEFDEKLKAELAKQRSQMEAEITAQLIGEFSKPEVTEAPPVVEDAEEAENKLVYRCLDCGEEFDSVSLLSAHKDVAHKDETDVPKKGRKAKA